MAIAQAPGLGFFFGFQDGGSFFERFGKKTARSKPPCYDFLCLFLPSHEPAKSRAIFDRPHDIRGDGAERFCYPILQRKERLAQERAAQIAHGGFFFSDYDAQMSSTKETYCWNPL